ncbi:MAG: glycosyltransferase family 4 protein [Pseudomonadota bacterium]
MKRPAVFAIPGDINARTGGYIYEKTLLLELRRQGRAVTHLALPGSYPDPTEADLAETVAALAAIPAETPAILDGFLTGATDPAGLAQMQAPFVAVTHHPLALETGLSAARAAHLRAVERANLVRAAHVLVPSPLTAQVLSADYGVPAGRITVAQPGIEQPGPWEGEVAEPPMILAVGQIVPRKGFDIFLKALQSIVDAEWQAVIVGGGLETPYGREVQALCETLDLGARVRFTGALGDEDLGALYRKASVFALATRYEGYGMVFGEALVHGLPVVSCRAGAVPWTVPSDAGVLVPPDDPARFAAALREVLSDRPRYAAAAAARGAALPGWADTAAIADGVLERLF